MLPCFAGAAVQRIVPITGLSRVIPGFTSPREAPMQSPTS